MDTSQSDSNGLNAFLQPVNSPVATNEGAAPSYYFDSSYETNAVSNSKISFISADKISAGTVTVGVNLGSTSAGYLLLDGANNRIIVNDGTTNRIAMGSV